MIELVIGQDSWATVAEASDYFSKKFGITFWASLTTDQKNQLLISAFNWIQQQDIFAIPDDISMINVNLQRKVKQAQCEAGEFINNYYAEYDRRRFLDSAGVKSFGISKFSERLDGLVFPKHIEHLLKDFVTTKGGTFGMIKRSSDDIGN